MTRQELRAYVLNHR
ncbi:DUF6887 family protein [Coleofasciculus sp. FACHB-125]